MPVPLPHLLVHLWIWTNLFVQFSPLADSLIGAVLLGGTVVLVPVYVFDVVCRMLRGRSRLNDDFEGKVRDIGRAIKKVGFEVNQHPSAQDPSANPPLWPTLTDWERGERELVPDSIEPIVAWRAWAWLWIVEKDIRLRSVVQPYVWTPRERQEAHCIVGRLSHEAVEAVCGPVAGCSCGFYAYKKRDNIYVHGADVWGQVYLWGRVLEGDLGYKAQYAYPKALIVKDSVPGQVARALADTYGVPVRSRFADRSIIWYEKGRWKWATSDPNVENM